MNGAGGQGWAQVGELLLAFGLSALIGLEREWRQKAAGLRTHTLVGVGAPLFALAGLALLAVVATAVHFAAVFGLGAIAPRLPRSRFAVSPLFVTYEDGRGALRDVLAECSRREFAIASVETHSAQGGSVSVALEVQGAGSLQELALAVDDLPGVIEVTAADINARTD